MKKRAVKLGAVPRALEQRLRKLNSPEKIQDFVSAMPWNFEQDGDTCRGVLETLRKNEAHCIEAAMVAALALLLAGRKPLLMDLAATDDDFDHVVALFKENGKWGAISKSNHGYLRYRDPIYRTLRELALSYFHEYFDKTGKKSLLSYSRPLDISKMGDGWITKDNAWEIPEKLIETPHASLVTKKESRALRPLDAFEQKAFSLREHAPRK
jgi:hypothetical protein